jgi:hypothetical protein
VSNQMQTRFTIKECRAPSSQQQTLLTLSKPCAHRDIRHVAAVDGAL